MLSYKLPGNVPSDETGAMNFQEKSCPPLTRDCQIVMVWNYSPPRMAILLTTRMIWNHFYKHSRKSIVHIFTYPNHLLPNQKVNPVNSQEVNPFMTSNWPPKVGFFSPKISPKSPTNHLWIFCGWIHLIGLVPNKWWSCSTLTIPTSRV